MPQPLTSTVQSSQIGGALSRGLVALSDNENVMLTVLITEKHAVLTVEQFEEDSLCLDAYCFLAADWIDPDNTKVKNSELTLNRLMNFCNNIDSFTAEQTLMLGQILHLTINKPSTSTTAMLSSWENLRFEETAQSQYRWGEISKVKYQELVRKIVENEKEVINYTPVTIERQQPVLKSAIFSQVISRENVPYQKLNTNKHSSISWIKSVLKSVDIKLNKAQPLITQVNSLNRESDIEANNKPYCCPCL